MLDGHRDLAIVSYFLRRRIVALLVSLVLWRFQARNTTCRFTSRSLTQRPIGLTGEIVRYSTARVSKRLTDKTAACLLARRRTNLIFSDLTWRVASRGQS